MSNNSNSNSNNNNIFSDIPGGGNPSFRDACINNVIIVPLLSSSATHTTTSSQSQSQPQSQVPSHSIKSFNELFKSLQRHNYCSKNHQQGTSKTTSASTSTSTSSTSSEVLLVVPNNTLTRPGDWRYNDTPFSSFHWHHGCQRIQIHDGRSNRTRYAYDKLSNCTSSPGSTTSTSNNINNWIDLYPYRRTAAVVGVLSLKDCKSVEDFHTAENELRQWCTNYSTPPYSVTKIELSLINTTEDIGTTGSSSSSSSIGVMDVPVIRMFVYDSFTEGSVDLSNTIYLGSNRIVAFPPSLGILDNDDNDDIGSDSVVSTNLTTNIHLMNLHLNVVISDLVVTIFRDLENKIKEYRTIVTNMSNNSNGTTVSSTVGNNNNNNNPSMNNNNNAARRTIQRFVTNATNRATGISGSGATSSGSIGSFNVDDNSTGTTATTSTNTVLDDTTSVASSLSSPKQTSSTIATSSTTTGGSIIASNIVKNLTIGSMAGLVSPESKLAKDSPTTKSSTTTSDASSTSSSNNNSSNNKLPRLVTPLDDDMYNTKTTISSVLLQNDVAIRKRDIGRWEKWCGDISLLAGSPLDAYEHYLKASEILSSKIIGAGSAATNVPLSLDPLWHSFALIGCASAHIAMADCGGYNIDEYLENNFQLPDEVMISLYQYHSAIVDANAASRRIAATTTAGGSSSSSANATSATGTTNSASAAATGASTSTMTTTGAPAGDDTTIIPKRVPTNKQTLPEVVFTLCEESLTILSRNRKFGNLYAELLLKLAKYCSNEAESHLKCQWGYGFGCYSGITGDDNIDGTSTGGMYNTDNDGPIGTSTTNSNSSSDGDTIPRYLKTSTSKLLVPVKRLPVGLYDMAMMNTMYRTRKVCELLHTAVAITSLSSVTRVDVAAQCTIICLNGIKPTSWKNEKLERTKLPRKAAFFSCVAAEALTLAKQQQPQKCRDYWLLSSQLYSRTPNPSNSFISGTYGWASLRAYCLEALSMQGTSRLSLESSLDLLSLLSELQPIKNYTQSSSNSKESTTTTRTKVDSDKSSTAIVAQTATPKIKNIRQDDSNTVRSESTSSLVKEGITDSERTGASSSSTSSITGPSVRTDFGLSLDETEIREAVANAARNIRDNYRITMASASALISNQMKATDGEPITIVQVPFADLGTIPSGLHSLNSVWPYIDYEACVYAQKHCMERISTLRRSLPTLSGSDIDSLSIDGSDGQKLPLYVKSAIAIQVEADLEMECVKKVTVPDKSKDGAMATFYNPFEAKKKDGNESTIRVAEEEERAVKIKFGNKLSLPIEIRRSQLEFENDIDGRLQAASLSFVVPARATSFSVQFPFTILSKTTTATTAAAAAATATQVGDKPPNDNHTEYKVKGLDLTCFGRSFFLPIKELSDTSSCAESGNLPDSASLYPYRSVKKSVTEVTDTKPQVETFPCQPRLHVMYAETAAPVDRIVIGLSDGEIYTLPKVRLENYMGPSCRGKIQQLQIYSVNVPLMSDKKLYDSETSPAEIVNEAEFDKDIVWKENSSPFLLRLQAGKLNLQSINSVDGKSDTPVDDNNNTFTFQLAAAHNLGEKMKKNVNLSIRFRYRGLSSLSTDVWRKKEILLHIRHVKGPRISSIAFRHDLSIESALGEMSQTASLHKIEKLNRKVTSIDDSAGIDSELALLTRVGLDNEIGICGHKSYFVLTVANETKSVLSLERATAGSSGSPVVGGLDNIPLQTITVRPGVSAKIPFTIQRLSRVDESGQPVDVVSELVARTTLQWKSHVGGETGPVKARGNIRIPPSCLKDIIGRYPSFLSHVCEAPCTIRLFVGKFVDKQSEIHIGLGVPVDVSVQVDISKWVPKHIIDKCTLTIEFRCGRKHLHGSTTSGSSTSMSSTIGSNNTNNNKQQEQQKQYHDDYCWAGKLRHTIPMNTSNKKHDAKIMFCSIGRYVVSSCVKISHRGSSGEESWWAPIAQTISVQDCPIAQ